MQLNENHVQGIAGKLDQHCPPVPVRNAQTGAECVAEALMLSDFPAGTAKLAAALGAPEPIRKASEAMRSTGMVAISNAMARPSRVRKEVIVKGASMETKHTPGPWTVDHNENSMEVVIHAEGMPGTKGKWPIAACNYDGHPQLEEHTVANARFIASAPQLLAQRDALLAVCKATIEDIEGMWDDTDQGGPQFLPNDPILVRLRSALATK